MALRDEFEKLERLQELDIKIDRAKKYAAGAPGALAPLETDIRAEGFRLEAAKTQKAALEKQKSSCEVDNMMDGDRIKNIEARIGQVTNNKEWHAAQKESDKAKKMMGDREVLSQELIKKIQTQAETIATIEASIAEMQSKLDSQKGAMGERVGEMDKEIASYSDDRSSIVTAIEPNVMSKYNRLRTRMTDPVAFVRTGACMTCNLALPPQMYNLVQKGLELLHCPSCQRMLYFKN